MTALWAVAAPSGSGRKKTTRRESTKQTEIAYTSLERICNIGGGTRTEMTLWAVPAPSGSGRKEIMSRESTKQTEMAYTSLKQEYNIGGGDSYQDDVVGRARALLRVGQEGYHTEREHRTDRDSKYQS